MENIVNTFLKIVQIDSPSGKEELISKYLQAWLTKRKFIIKVDNVGNIYATNNKQGKPILFCAHMDTVQPGEGIKPVIKNGVIKSSGKTILGADNKAALAAILTAIETTKPEKNLELLFTVKEETGGGVEFFPFKWIKAKQGIIFDKSNPLGGIVLSSPHICNFHVSIQGKATHSGTPQNGINAFVPAFKALSKIKVGLLDKGKTTINIGVIKGGTGINTVPENIQVAGEIRSYEKILFRKHLEQIKNTFAIEVKKYQSQYEFYTDGYCAGYSFTQSDAFVKRIVSVYNHLQLPVKYFFRSGISDANVLNEHQIQTINLTDGAKYPHTKAEQIAVKDLESLSNVIVACIETF